MSVHRMTRWGAGLFAVLSACNHVDSRRGEAHRLVAAPSVDPGSGAGGAGGSTADFSAAGSTFGDAPLLNVPDTPCASVAMVPTTLYGASSGMPPFDRTRAVGERRIAFGSRSGGFVTFDADGAHASSSVIALPGDYNVVSGEGNTIGIAAADAAEAIVFRRFDASGEALTEPLVLGHDVPTNIVVAGGAGASMVVWGVSGRLRARRVDAMGARTSPAFDFAEGLVTTYFTAAMTLAATDFALVWTGDDGSGAYATWFARLGPEAPNAAPSHVVLRAPLHRTVDVAPFGQGFVILLDAITPTAAPMLAFLDAAGLLAGPLRVLHGARFAFGLAAREDRIAVVAERLTGEVELRTFDATGAPRDDWACLSAPSDAVDHEAAVDVDADGFVVLSEQADGAEVLFHVPFTP